MNNEHVDDLNLLVTKAILVAERCLTGTERASHAWSIVSVVEEALALEHPAGDVEGDVARRGAVTAALAAGDEERADRLMLKYGHPR